MSKECKCSGVGDAFHELEPIIKKYAGIKGSLITILQNAQDIYGYLPTEVIEYISEKTGISPAKIYGVATFYTQFRLKPIGKYLIMVCMGTACHVNGASAIEIAIEEHLSIKDGETTADELFTLNVVACLGCCSLAPVIMIKGPDGENTYGNLTKESVKTILDDIATSEKEASA